MKQSHLNSPSHANVNLWFDFNYPEDPSKNYWSYDNSRMEVDKSNEYSQPRKTANFQWDKNPFKK